jgi:hypothetical protein
LLGVELWRVLLALLEFLELERELKGVKIRIRGLNLGFDTLQPAQQRLGLDREARSGNMRQ